MKYFTLLPKHTYNDGVSARILDWKYYFETDIDPSYLDTYRIGEDESLESICFNLYTDASIWWIIAILNGFRDVIFDMPLNEETIQKIAQDLATNYGEFELGDKLSEYTTNYDLLIEKNDDKRVIRVIKPNFLQPIIRDIVRQT